MKKKNRRQRHIPERTCVGCREVLSKKDMIRVVRTPEGVRIDSTGKLPGRGAYLHQRKSCWQHALSRGSLANALKVEFSDESNELLSAYMDQLSDP
ncbi:MAG: YlxR family protein [Anaerolineales bacterium]|nr:YlxR family protein [Anaerolineales bacterium]